MWYNRLQNYCHTTYLCGDKRQFLPGGYSILAHGNQMQNQAFNFDYFFISIFLVACQQGKLAFEGIAHQVIRGLLNTHILAKLLFYSGD